MDRVERKRRRLMARSLKGERKKDKGNKSKALANGVKRGTVRDDGYRSKDIMLQQERQTRISWPE
jgi:hypothetical protein